MACFGLRKGGFSESLTFLDVLIRKVSPTTSLSSFKDPSHNDKVPQPAVTCVLGAAMHQTVSKEWLAMMLAESSALTHMDHHSHANPASLMVHNLLQKHFHPKQITTLLQSWILNLSHSVDHCSVYRKESIGAV